MEVQKMKMHHKEGKRNYAVKTVTNYILRHRYETCILCGIMTDIPKSMPVSMRTGYITGAGQLCKSCAEIISDVK